MSGGLGRAWRRHAALVSIALHQGNRIDGGEDVASFKAILDCRWDPHWSWFLDMLQANMDAGLPVDIPLVQKAVWLVERDPDVFSLVEGPEGKESPAWPRFVESLCMPGPSNPPICLLGHIAAEWFIARHGGAPGANSTTFLKFANAHAGLPFRQLDFSEESAWPVQPLDILASLSRGRRPRGPHVANPRGTPKWIHGPWPMPIGRVVADEPPLRICRSGPPSIMTLRAWELGIHKTLAAEILTTLHRAASTGGGSLHARNLISHQYPARLPRCELYRNAGMACNEQFDDVNRAVERHVVWSAAKHWISGQHPEVEFPHVIQDVDLLAADLRRVAEPLVREVDFLVITQPAALLMAVMGVPRLLLKPIVLYMSTHMYYMIWARERARFRELFVTAARDPKNIFVVNYAWLQLYVQRLGGITLPTLQGLSLYTGVARPRNATRGLLVLDRPKEEILACLLRDTVRALEPAARSEVVFRQELQGGSWQEMASFAAAAIFPYTVFLLAFEELYSMAVPIFIPRHLSKHSYQYWYTVTLASLPASLREAYDPWRPETFHYLGYTEFFRRPQVATFDSLAELMRRVSPGASAALTATRSAMRLRVASARRSVLAFWRGELARRVR